MENNNSVCYVGRVTEVKAIEGADNIELGVIGGWNAIIQKGQYKVDELVVVATTDAVIPVELSDAINVTSYLRKGGRVRTVKLRGVYSECLIIPFNIAESITKTSSKTMTVKVWNEGDDLMEVMNIFKYEPPVRQVQLASGRKVKYKDNPNFGVYYKFPNLKNVTGMFTEKDRVEITRKLHGTNAGVSFNNKNGIWAQSKENIITIEKDNAGFAFHVKSNEEFYINSLKNFAKSNEIDLDVNTITVYGEYAGGGIQKGVAISNIQKSFFVFGVKISKPGDEEFKSFWINAKDFPRNPSLNIYNIYDYKTYEIDIDFKRPDIAQNKMIEIMSQVEEECPVSKEFGEIGIGEGNVWTIEYKDEIYRFKVKGEKHSSSKVKTLAAVDVEKLNSITEFIEYAVTESRFNQALENVFPNSEPIDTRKMGDLIRWVVNDVIKEESDTLAKNGLEPKDVNKYLSAKVREMFFKLEVQ